MNCVLPLPAYPFGLPRRRAARAWTLAFLAALALLPAAHANVLVTGGLSHEYSVQPGQTVKGTIHIKNDGDSPATVRLFQTDYLFQADGSNTFGKIGSQPRSNGAWVKLGNDRVTIAPGQTTSVPYTIAVPDDAALHGSFWSLVMVEQVSAQPTTTKKGISMRVLMRYGVQIVTTFDGGKDDLAFAHPQLSKNANGALTLSVDLNDVGQTLLKGASTLQLYDASGKLVTTVHTKPFRIYPTTSERATFVLKSVSGDHYTAIVLADAGSGNVYGARYTLNLTKNGGQ